MKWQTKYEKKGNKTTKAPDQSTDPVNNNDTSKQDDATKAPTSWDKDSKKE